MNPLDRWYLTTTKIKQRVLSCIALAIVLFVCALAAGYL